MDYSTTLETNNQIKLLEPLKNVKLHHKMQCLVCQHEWSATPLSKHQTFKKHGVGGCPACNITRRQATYETSRSINLDRLMKRGIQVLTEDYDGRHTMDKIQVRNIHCGHIFSASANNLIQAEVECGKCGPQKRVQQLTKWSKTNSARWQETASEWQKYKAEVSSITETTYKTHKKLINPTNLIRGKAGQDGAYHLDHIVPKRFCFDNNIPAEICAHHTNLQMIGWKENVGSRSHIKGTVPPLFFQYIPTATKMEAHVKQLLEIFPQSRTFVRIADVIVTLYDQQTNRAIIVIPIDKTHANLKSGSAAYKLLTALGIQVIILFEDEMSNKQLVASKLKHYAHQSITVRVHARECEIRLCPGNDKKILLDNYHMQGNDNAQISYGAFYQDKLVAVMTFATPQILL